MENVKEEEGRQELQQKIEERLIEEFVVFCKTERPRAVEHLEKKMRLVEMILDYKEAPAGIVSAVRGLDPEMYARAVHANIVASWLTKFNEESMKRAGAEAVNVVAKAFEGEGKKSGG